MLNIIFRIFSKEITLILYRAVLGRAPDPSGEKSCIACIRKTGDIESVLVNMFNSQEFKKKYNNLEAPLFVQQIYSGVLGREANDNERKSSVDLIQKEQSFVPLLKKISTSEELWSSYLHLRYEAIANDFYQGVFNRTPTREEVKTFSENIKKNNKFAPILHQLMHSEETWRQQIKLNSRAIVSDIFKAILKREAEEDAKVNYEKYLNSGNSLQSLIAIIVDSDEGKLRAHREVGWPEPENKMAHDIDFIFQQWSRFFTDRPSANDLMFCLEENALLGERIKKIVSKKIGHQSISKSLKKILLFGAFGNGNIGDAYQAVAIRDQLSTTWGIPIEAFDACSYLKTNDYPFPGGEKLPGQQILSRKIVNQYDLLIIGGGGLLAHPHEPLMYPSWVRSLSVPIAVIGVGATREWVMRHDELLRRAWIISARDFESLQALRSLREDAFLLKDPILCSNKKFFSHSLKLKTNNNLLEIPNNKKILWILKYPSNSYDEEALTKIKEIVSNSPYKHQIIGVEPKADSILQEIFEIKIDFVNEIDSLIKYIFESDIVVSMRYHGVIFSAIVGRPSVGLSQSKISHLFSESRLPGQFIFDVEKLEFAIEVLINKIEANPSMIERTMSDLEIEFKETLKAQWFPNEDFL